MTLGITLRKCLMYFLHFLRSTVDQKASISSLNSCFVFGFTSLRITLLVHAMGFFYGVKIWRLGRGTPPIDSLHYNEVPCIQRCTCMFGIIVSHEFVAIRLDITNERKECLFQNLGYYSLKNANSCSSTEVDAFPDMDFQRVLIRPVWNKNRVWSLPTHVHVYTSL